jgi:hypothetical protein
MTRRVSAVYRSRALAQAAAERLTAAKLGGSSLRIAEQEAPAEAQSGMFDRLAQMLSPDGTGLEHGFTVSVEVPSEQVDAAAIALEPGAERVEMVAPPRLTEQVVELSETAEKLILEKQAMVREEIVMRVQTREQVQDIHDVVRRTEVDVERIAAVHGEKPQDPISS